ncbi:MAG: phospholipase D-like domain-containing protein, partial [Gammaproteobacteria bacterium]|nr:phospholipase D-like domain-containing protein [Gammaproteobacteria bacterium]
VDIAYYIFKRDIVAHSILSRLCAAIKRGVDVRLIVDSLGSIHPTHTALKSLYSCADEAGYMYGTDGQTISAQRAGMQVVVFNALIHPEARIRSIFRIIKSLFSRKDTDLMTKWLNRRSHDKILLIDGQFSDRAIAMIGGRNISVDYYEIDKNGRTDPNAYKDLEVLIKSGDASLPAQHQIGKILASYFDKIFNHNSNKKLFRNPARQLIGTYTRKVRKITRKEVKLLGNEQLALAIEDMPRFFGEGFFQADAQLVHELGNLTDRGAVLRALQNEAANPNSILGNIRKIIRESDRYIKAVSPYLFLAKYKQVADDGTATIYDEGEILKRWLAQNTKEGKKRILEIITNSVLTTDNIPAQVMIDMEMAPELLLDPEELNTWRSFPRKILLRDRVSDEAWKRLAENEQLIVWQTGRLDAVEFGGTQSYGKLHVKLAIVDDIAFVGTTNVDHRSRLLNNEMGFIIRNSSEFVEQLIKEEFDTLRANSYKWGSTEWLSLRQKLKDKGGIKGKAVRHQENIYWIIKRFGLDWLI